MHIQSLPLELLTGICLGLADFDGTSSYLTRASLANIKSARSVSRLFRAATKRAFAEACFVFYPTRQSMKQLLDLSRDSELVPYIRKLKLIGVTFRQPHIVDASLWEEISGRCGKAWTYSFRDRGCIGAITAWHGAALKQQGNYNTSGQFRTDLTQALHNLHRLEMVRLDRDLAPGQHLPGWSGPALLPRLTGWTAWVDVGEIFYGDYVYQDKDGKKCQFLEDVFTALQARAGGSKVKVTVSSIPGRPFPMRKNVRGLADVDASLKEGIEIEEEHLRVYIIGCRLR